MKIPTPLVGYRLVRSDVENDIAVHWSQCGEPWPYAISEIGFSRERRAPFAAPGHWNDPGMLVVGYVGKERATPCLQPDSERLPPAARAVTVNDTGNATAMQI